ncbi:AAA family ATPase [Microbacterium marmarense]
MVWTHLPVGEVDRSTGTAYCVARRSTCCGLAIEQGVGLAFVGNPHQALPIRHAGAMGSAIRHANAAVELDTVHRFRDPEYAALTLRPRVAHDREHALAVAGELAERGHVERVDHHDAARERMIDAHFEWHARGQRVALVSGTNAEADAINDAIQQRRVDHGELDAGVVAWGMGEQRIFVGDTVQTRRNDRLTGVENRAQWIVRGIREEFVDLVSVSDAKSCGECLPSTRASTCSSPMRRPCVECSATPPMRRWSGRMWMRLGCTWVSPAGGCRTLRSWWRRRMMLPARGSPSRCSAALRS